MKEETIEQTAAGWLVKAQAGPLSDDMQARLDQWLQADRRHRGAYLRARAGMQLMDRAMSVHKPALANDNGARTSRAIRKPKRSVGAGRLGMAFGGLLAASLVAIIAIPSPKETLTQAPVRQAVESRVADVRRQTLQDGSVATLGRGGRIDVAMSPAERRVILLSGHATFDVAKDPARPFVVQSGAVRAQALGTVFTVRRLGDEGGLIEVTEGQVKVWSVRGEARSVVIHAGESLKLEPDAERRAAKTRQAPRQMSIDDDTVGAIAGRMNAVNRTKIVIENPETEKMEIVGLFSETEPARFAEAVSAISGDEITYDNGTIVIKRRN